MSALSPGIPQRRRWDDAALPHLRNPLELARTALGSWTARAALGVGLLAAILYTWDLSISGYGNDFYAAAALAASQSWKAWFFGSLDAANFITVDKPPLATMLMGLSVRVFGLSSWSILLPQALLGVASVLLLFEIVRRQFGTVAATIAGVVLALTPVAVLMFRYDHPDALLTFLMLAAAYGVQRAIEHGRHRWLVLAGVAVGLAFLTKYLQGFLVIPALLLAYLVAANAPLRRRIAGVALFCASTLLAAGSWVAAVELTPGSLRPYIGGSTNNSVLDLVFGYDGLGRIFGGSAGNGQGSSFSGVPGLLRLFNAEFGGQIGWLLPFAAAALAIGLILTLRAPRTDPGRAGYLLWGGWLAVHAVVFSFMSGIVHSYYAVAMAPAVAALVGAGAVALWRLRERFRFGGMALAALVLLTVAWAAALLARSPGFAPGLAPVAVGGGVVAALLVALPVLRRRRLGAAIGVAALAAMLAGPAAFSMATATTAYSGSIVSAGPAATAADFLSGSQGGGMGGMGSAGPGGAFQANAPQGGNAPSMAQPTGTPPSGSPSGSASSAAAGAPSRTGGTTAGDGALSAYLLANRGSATWIVAVSGSMEAAQLELQTGAPVMAMGGWSGTDDALTLAQLQADVASGKLRFVLIGGQGAGGQNGGTSEITAWVTANGKAVTISGGSGSWTLYDLAALATTSGGTES